MAQAAGTPQPPPFLASGDGLAQAPKPSPFLSQKMRFWSFVSMVLLIYVHGYNMHDGYLQPFTLPRASREPYTFTVFFEYLMSNGILRFRIPMLFAISGYLFALGDAKPHGRRMLKRLRTLGIPYLAWGVIALGITWLLEHWTNNTCQAVINSGIAGEFMMEDYPWQDYMHRFFFPINFQFWFLRALIFVNLIYPGLRNGIRRRPKAMFWVAGVLWATSPISLSFIGYWVFSYWSLDSVLSFISPEGILFFMVGIYYAKRGGVPQSPPRQTKPWHWLAAWLGLSLLATVLSMYFTDYSAATVIPLLLLHKMVVFTGLVAAWHNLDGLVRRFMAWPAFVWASAFSFVIYALHVPLINYLTQLAFLSAKHLPGYRLATYIFLPILIVGFCIAIGAGLRSLSPMVYGWLTGGRGLQSIRPKREVA